MIKISDMSQNQRFIPVFSGKTAIISTAELNKLRNSGKTIKAIVSELGISKGTYYKLLRERGFDYNNQGLSKKLSLIPKFEIEKMLSENFTIKQICKKFNINESAFYKLAEFHKIKTQSKIYKDKLEQIDISRFKEFIITKCSIDEVCAKFGITISMYYALINKYKIETPRIQNIKHNSKITKEQILQLKANGKSFNEILKILNITDSTYAHLLQKFNIDSVAKPYKDNISKITKEKLVSMLECGKKVKDICQELNIPERTYTRLIDKFGIITERKKAKLHFANITKTQLQELVDMKMSPLAICEELKINESSFYRLLKLHKVDYNYQHHHNQIDLSKNDLEVAIDSKKTVKEIASNLGISVSTYHNKARELGVKTFYRDSIDTIASVTKEELQDAVNMKMKIDDICKLFGITRANYSALIRKYNILTPQRLAVKKKCENQQ